jgi:hypothetical protein
MLNAKSAKTSQFIIFSLLPFLVGACALGGSPTETPTQVPLPVVTDTPPPALPLVLLFAPPESDPAIAAAAAELAAGFAASNGMQFEQRSVLDTTQLPANLSKLIVLAPDPGAAALAAAAPQASVIAVGFDPGAETSNMQTLQGAGSGSDEIAFIAGYVAALTADDWRMGMLHTGESLGQVDDFLAGAEYYCGSCAPVAPPYNDYPQAAAATDEQNWQPAADQLIFQSVRVVYLAPELEVSGAAQYLVSYGILIIGSGPPPADVAANWLASVGGVDAATALREQLPLALAGQPLTAPSSLAISNANPSYLSEARLAHVQTIINDLLGGFISLPNSQ